MIENNPKLSRRPFVMIIRDGWGYNPDCAESKFNAIKQAKTPVDDMLMGEYPNCLIETSGEDVGLPAGTMGNSEVGHQNIGAGRVVYQSSVKITKAIREGDFFENAILLGAFQKAKDNGGKVHVMGLCSDIGVHSLLGHLYALLEMAKRQGFEDIYLHAFTDGRDSPPTSGAGYIAEIEKKMGEIGAGKIASIAGRFYAMDRDLRWERVQEAFDCLTVGEGNMAKTAAEAMEASYANEETDEFVKPVCIDDGNGEPVALIENGDSVICFNFRGDRPREITRAFVEGDGFDGFERKGRPCVHYVCMTEYNSSIPAEVAFAKETSLKNIGGDYFSKLGLKQFRCAETEKYAHVTFFFNCGREEPFEGEERQIVPSPKVRTYDLKPSMSANEVCDVIMEKLESNVFDVIIMNFANPDMVGHTGVLAAAVEAAETVDACVGKILAKVKSLGGAAVVLADHGNFEKMWDGKHNMEHTAHTIGKVPFIVFYEKYKNCKMRDGGRLADAIPTMLEIMEIEKPEEMTGNSLIIS
ncbi:MAG: 2,3-bisphosphoglycerate-independent phosphoglycerate mutase [Planctomycetes bacterium]|nr:2,3-bisphosphoglycerate-independent phosphoglycerate mutase [Planctomycetota bacterium]